MSSLIVKSLRKIVLIDIKEGMSRGQSFGLFPGKAPHPINTTAENCGSTKNDYSKTRQIRM